MTHQTTPRVVLLHGIWNARMWLEPLAWRLRRHGFVVETVGYSSILGGPEVAVPQLIKRLQRIGPVSLVGHSLGGLLALETLRQSPELAVDRVVCLGSPLRGSNTARVLAGRGGAAVLGRSGDLLLRGVPEWSGRAEVGVVAGRVARGLGCLIGAVGEASDGTVAESETRLPGIRDYCMVNASHTGLVLSADAVRQAACFLREGRFSSVAGRLPR